ncbi:MAG TPA: hypothetical protein VGR72_13265 [Candidatus Acidoferrales bacterium]|nr:hypothetical protein [Candidatus Acidoferrales bacterium]
MAFVAQKPDSSEGKPGPSLSPEENYVLLRSREISLSRLLMAYVSTGLFFMLLPGTFLGVWNLLQISGNESAGLISPAWLQAHGHAQVFGWIGSFILGIGFYSIPKLRGTARLAFASAWTCWAMWTLGVAMRWAANVYYWRWRTLLPLSAALELAAFAIFLITVSQHRPDSGGKSRMEPWIWVVASASVGLLLTLIVNLAVCLWLALRGASPALPHLLDQRYLVLMTWGFLVPFVWGFSAKWMPVFVGLKPNRPRLLLSAAAMNFAGVALALAGKIEIATGIFVISTALAIAALRMFEPSQQEPKIRGVHKSMPIFVRMGLRLASGCSATGGCSSGLGYFRRDLGRFAACADCRLRRHHGVLRGAEDSARVRRDAFALEHAVNVHRAGSAGDGVRDARVL